MSPFEVGVEDTAVVARRRDVEVVVDTTGWTPTDDAPPIGNVPIDETRAGHVTELRLPIPDMSIEAERLDADLGADLNGNAAVGRSESSYMLSDDVTVPPGEYRFDIDSEQVRLYIRFDATAEVAVEVEPGDGPVLRFQQPTAVRIGVRFDADRPRETVRVPPTPSGLADAVSTFRTALRATTPDVSWPTFRVHPPRVEFTDGGAEPDLAGLQEEGPDTGIELVVPDEVGAVMAAASPAFYLGATVRTVDGDEPAVLAPSAGVERSLPDGVAFQRAVTRLLYRTHRLDCLVRTAGPHGAKRREARLLEDQDVDHGLDLTACYDLSAAERLARYLAVDDAALSVFPPQPLAVVLPDHAEAGRALPSLADRLATVHTPAAVEELHGSSPFGDLQSHGSDDSMAWPRTGPTGERLLGWAAADPPWSPDDGDDQPAAAFETGPAAIRRTAGDGPEGTTVVVVTDGVDPESPLETVRARASESQSETRVEHLANPSSERLATALSRPVDLLVYVAGERPEPLPVGDDVGVDLAVFDAPASLSAGRALVEGGAPSAICARPGESGARPGLAPVGFLLHGVMAADAVALSRRVDEAPPETTTFGDAARSLDTFRNGGMVNEIVKRDRYHVRTQNFGGEAGGVIAMEGAEAGTEYSALVGTPLERQFVGSLQQWLADATVRIHDGSLYWPEETPELLNPVV